MFFLERGLEILADPLGTRNKDTLKDMREHHEAGSFSNKKFPKRSADTLVNHWFRKNGHPQKLEGGLQKFICEVITKTAMMITMTIGFNIHIIGDICCRRGCIACGSHDTEAASAEGGRLRQVL